MTNSTFTEQGTIDLNAGEIGGDLQATDAVSRRFVRTNDDSTFTVVDIYAYGSHEVKDDEDETVQLDVQVITIVTECTDPTDPGSSELSSEMDYSHPYNFAPSTLEQAYRWAENYVRAFSASHLD